jgi:hypothetical protein
MLKDRPRRILTAVTFLYVVSLLGIIELFTTPVVTGKYGPAIYIDIIAYCVLFVCAVGIAKGIAVMRSVYAILAIVWYAALVFYLPASGHEVNLGLVAGEVILIVASFYLLYQPKCKAWFSAS